ncbi:hypothetical protein [Thalassospira sp.]|uniref:hypothetical protein n=1 Tax=Thalassospira sp. TaxID=1912094 RepID=UPI003AA95173
MKAVFSEGVLCCLIKYSTILLIFIGTVAFLLLHVDGRINRLLIGQGALEVNFEGGVAGLVEENKSNGSTIVDAAISEIERSPLDQVTDVAVFYAVNGMKYTGKPAFTPYQVCSVLKMVRAGSNSLEQCDLREFQRTSKAIEVLYSAYILERFNYYKEDSGNPRYGFNRFGRDFAAKFLDRNIVLGELDDNFVRSMNMERMGKLDELNDSFLSY